MRVLRNWWPVLFLAALPLLPLWRCVFLGEGIGPWGHIRAMAPWNGPEPDTPWDVLQADGVLQFAVWRDLVFEAWGKGQLPFWNPYQLMGTPLLANSQSAGFYPPHILMGLLHVPTVPAITFLAWLHLFWAGLGVYFLVRCIGGNRVGGVVAGASFSLSAFMVAWTPIASVITTVSWIPWMLGCIYAVFTLNWTRLAFLRNKDGVDIPEGELGQWAEHEAELDARNYARYKRHIASLAISTAMMLLAGHLQFAAYGLLAAVLVLLGCSVFVHQPFKMRDIGVTGFAYVVSEGVESARQVKPPFRAKAFISPTLRSAASTIFALGIGFCIAASQLLPVMQFSKLSHRQNIPSEDGYRAYIRGAVARYELSGLVLPAVLGNPQQRHPSLAGLSTFWPALMKQGAHMAESALSIGPLILLGILLMRRRDWTSPPTFVLGTIALVGLLIALGSPLNRVLYFHVPGWSASGSPGRASVLFVMAACALGGVGVSGLTREGTSWLRSGLIAVAIVLAPYLLLLLALSGTLPDPYRLDKVLGNSVSFAMLSAFSASLIAIAITLLPLLPSRVSWQRPALLLLAAGCLAPLLFNFRFPLATGTPVPREGPHTRKRIAVVNDRWELLVRQPAILPPNTAAWSRLRDAGGYDSLLDRDTKAFLDGINGQDSAPATNGNMMLIKPSFDPGKLAAAGVTEVWSRQPLPQIAERPILHPEWLVYELSGPGLASVTHPDQSPGLAKARAEEPIVSAGFRTTHAHVEGPGRLILRERNLPGWSAQRSGAPLPIRAGFFLEVDLPAGSSKVVFQYIPPGLALGLVLGCFGLASLALLLSWVSGRRLRLKPAIESKEERPIEHCPYPPKNSRPRPV